MGYLSEKAKRFSIFYIVAPHIHIKMRPLNFLILFQIFIVINSSAQDAASLIGQPLRGGEIFYVSDQGEIFITDNDTSSQTVFVDIQYLEGTKTQIGYGKQNMEFMMQAENSETNKKNEKSINQAIERVVDKHILENSWNTFRGFWVPSFEELKVLRAYWHTKGTPLPKKNILSSSGYLGGAYGYNMKKEIKSDIEFSS